MYHLEEVMEEIVNEGILGSILGGLTGFALGKAVLSSSLCFPAKGGTPFSPFSGTCLWLEVSFL